MKKRLDLALVERGLVSGRDRAKALIKIAHPKFRDELKLEYERRFLEPYDLNSMERE